MSNQPTLNSRIEKHANAVGLIADAFLKRRNAGLKHPVHDFLFTYYSFSPNKLKQWVPSLQEHLIVSDIILQDCPWLNEYWFQRKENILSYRTERIHDNIRDLAKFIKAMCSNILERPPRFGCFGMHEWAMVYKLPPEQIRHTGYRLRMSPKELADFVDSQTICCTHYDAYRFFTKEAHPLNVLNPVLETRLELEQGGCLHANMDLYKWSTKLWPWIGSDFIAKTFFLALEGRELDMRASPYDLTIDSYEPILIETEAGRLQYQKEQQALAEKATPLREELQAFCNLFLEAT